MGKVGQWTDDVITYENIAKSNGINTDDDGIKEFIMDIVNLNEQRNDKENGNEVVEKIINQNEFQKYMIGLLGNFYFNFHKRLDGKLKPMNLTRFLYLCCYMDYKNRLVKKVGSKLYSIKENELQDLLGLGRTEYYSTKKELVGSGLIIIEEDKSVVVNSTYCKRGSIIKNSRVGKIRMFNNGIKDLYEKCTPKEHKKLTFLFDIIPYCHYNYNIVCRNPKEEVCDKIEYINVRELCAILNFSNVTVFRNKLMDLKVNNKPVFDIHNINRKEVITINPQVYYNGNAEEDLKCLSILFDLCCGA